MVPRKVRPHSPPVTAVRSGDEPEIKTIQLPNGQRKRAKDVTWDDIPPELLDDTKKETLNLTWRLWLHLKDMADSQHTDRSGAVRLLIRNHAAGYTRQGLEKVSGEEPLIVDVAPLYRRVLAQTALQSGETPTALVNRILGEQIEKYIQEARKKQAAFAQLEKDSAP